MQCMSCGNKTDQSGTIYIGEKIEGSGDGLDARYSYHQEEQAICTHCVHHYENGPIAFLFYAALQLGWLAVFQQGLLSPVGIIGVALAAFGLIRFVQKAHSEISYRRTHTTATSSPAPTLSPGCQANDFNNPGIGETTYLDMSAALRFGISLASSATGLRKTTTLISAPRW